MKILHVLQSFRYSGAENVVLFIINNLKDEYDFLYCSRKGQISEILEENNVKYQLIDNLNVTNLAKVIKKYKPDIIHAHDVQATLLCSILKGQSKLISHIHVNNENMSKINLKTVLLCMSSFRVNKFFWVSKSCYNEYIFKKYIKRKSRVLMNILSEKDILDKSSRDSNEYDYDIVYIGRLTYQKNPERLMKICREVCNQKNNIKIAIIGAGEMEGYVKKCIDEYNLHNIDLLGYKNNPLKILKNSKVMIMTSRFEGTPMVALESLALGTPIVSTPVDGMMDLVINDYNGYLTNNDEEFIEYVIEIVENQEKQHCLSLNSIKRFKELCNEDQYFDEIRKGYENNA